MEQCTCNPSLLDERTFCGSDRLSGLISRCRRQEVPPPGRTKKPPFFGDSILIPQHVPALVLQPLDASLNSIQNGKGKGMRHSIESLVANSTSSPDRHSVLYSTIHIPIALLVRLARLTCRLNRFAWPTPVASTPAAFV